MMKNEKINKMEHQRIENTFVTHREKMEVIRDLLSESWIKKDDDVLYKERNNYDITLTGKNHPIWNIEVTPKNKKFSQEDWKLRKDFKSIKNLGRKLNKNLYINENNKEEIMLLIDTMVANDFRLIYSDNYVLLRERDDVISIFKIAASMTMKEKEDGWYVGKKKIM